MMIVYTDGSRIPGQDNSGYAGIGIWFGKNDVRNSSIPVNSRNPTNQLAELLAIDNALRICKDYKEVIIKTDSDYSIKCITEWSMRWRENGWRTSKGEDVANSSIIKNILDKVSYRHSKGHITRFEHVYGHKGDVGNEGADRLAVAASLKVERLAMSNTIYFYSHTHGTYKSFSPFYPCVIRMIYDGEEIEYNCAEQHHHHRKAVMFGDTSAAEKIMKSDSPGQQMRIGRQVNNFNQERWVLERYEICRRCTIAKFSQNDGLTDLLTSTSGMNIAEASPQDCVWGIGLSESDSRAKAKWKGMNLLGKVLVDIRDNVFC